MLMRYLRREDLLSIDYERLSEVPAFAFDVADLHNLTTVAMLQQTGYLTVKDYDPDSEDFTFGVPDEEVRRDRAIVVTGSASALKIKRGI